ncbi:MAG: NAD(P)H-dependent oxidoreductase [Sphingomonas bacterium]|nr:NAD(P)H-dependent oxidoreductase [Sphingomonas bacterium]
MATPPPLIACLLRALAQRQMLSVGGNAISAKEHGNGLPKIDSFRRKFMPKSDKPASAERPSKTQKAVSHLIVLGHPGPKSFNAAIAHQYEETVQANYQNVILRDLYALGFDPLLKEPERTASTTDAVAADVRVELDLIDQCDVLTFVFPLWFGMPPAIIKGYVDRVLGAGFKAGNLGRAEDGVFQGKRLAVLTTSASTLPWLEAQGMWISLRQSFDHYMGTVFGFTASGHYHAGSIVDDLSPTSAKQILYEVNEFTRDICATNAMLHRQK